MPYGRNYAGSKSRKRCNGDTEGSSNRNPSASPTLNALRQREGRDAEAQSMRAIKKRRDSANKGTVVQDQDKERERRCEQTIADQMEVTRPQRKGNSGEGFRPSPEGVAVTGPSKAKRKCKAPKFAKNFVFSKHCEILLDVILQDVDTYLAVEQGNTHARKTNARIKLTKALIEADPQLVQCFGDAKFIEESGALKIKDTLTNLKKKYTKAVSMANATGAGAEGEDKAWRPFAGANYDEARRKAHELFRDSSAVHLHTVRTNESKGALQGSIKIGERSEGNEGGNSTRKLEYVTLREALEGDFCDDEDSEYDPVDAEDGEEDAFHLSQEERNGDGIGSPVKSSRGEEIAANGATVGGSTEAAKVAAARQRSTKDVVVTPAESLATRRAQGIAAVARRTALSGARSRGDGREGNGKESSKDVAAFAPTNLFDKMAHSESLRHDTERTSEKNSGVKAKEEALEARARAKAVEARTHRDKVGQAMKIMESQIKPEAKALLLKAMGIPGLDELDERML